VALITFVAYVLDIALLPRVKVENLTRQNLDKVEVELPNELITFENMSTLDIYIQKHSLNQSAGRYKYRVWFASGAKLDGECGHITSYEFGKMFLFTVRSENEVTCNR
jgi:hypothetical protein